MKFISEQHPDLHIPTIRVQFRDGVADVTTRGQIAYLMTPWMQRRGVRPADDDTAAVPVPAEPAPAVATEPEPEISEPADTAVPDGTAADVLAWVGDDPDRARQAAEVEQGREKPRTSLLAKLAKLGPDADPTG